MLFLLLLFLSLLFLSLLLRWLRGGFFYGRVELERVVDASSQVRGCGRNGR
jgi:DNA-directed RNA polymerase